MNENVTQAINWLKANLHSTSSNFRIEDKNGKIIIHGNVLIPSDIEELPYKIDEVFGNVIVDNICEPVRYGNLKSFKNFPTVVHGDVVCKKNTIKSLVGCPEQVDGNFVCVNCGLTSIKGMPKVIKGNFIAFNNGVNDMSPILESKISGLVDLQFNPCEKTELYAELRVKNKLSEIQ